jgi:pyrroloquinoline quinone biosynthesis protein D
MTTKLEAQVPAIVSMFRLQWEPAQDSHVLLYPEGMVKLSQSAGEIMKRIDGLATVENIIGDLSAAFGGADVKVDVINFLEQARDNGWITF